MDLGLKRTHETVAKRLGALPPDAGHMRRLEVAIGLETVQPHAIEHLNKRLDLGRFERVAGLLTEKDIDLRVFALLGWGGYASAAVAAADSVVRMPASMSFEHGAGFGIVYQTAYFALVYRAGLRAGETLLVHAAAGGVGLAAVQIGRALGARVLATAGSAEKLAVAREHGADEAFDYSTPDWVDGVKRATGGRGADVIYDPVGGEIFDLSTKAIAFSGRLLVIGFASGKIPTIQVNRILLKNIAVVGLHWGAYRANDPQKIGEAMIRLFALYEKGAVRPVISSVRPLAEAADALEEIASRKSVGKVLLVP